MYIKVQSWLGAPDLAITATRDMVLMVADHSLGKTSMIRAIQAVLSDGNPMGFSATLAQQYRKDGSENDIDIQFTMPSGTVSMDNTMSLSSSGSRPYASRTALGLTNLLFHKTTKQRGDAWRDIVSLEPDRQVLAEQLSMLTDNERDYYIELICGGSWDKAHTSAKSRLTQYKSQWEAAVSKCDGINKKWGAAVCQQWRPSGWDPLEKLTAEGTKVKLAERQTAVNDLQLNFTAKDSDQIRADLQKKIQDGILEKQALIKTRQRIEREKEEAQEAARRDCAGIQTRIDDVKKELSGYDKCRICNKLLKNGSLADTDRPAEEILEQDKSLNLKLEELNREGDLQAKNSNAIISEHITRWKETNRQVEDMETRISTLEGQLESLPTPTEESHQITQQDIDHANQELEEAKRNHQMATTVEEILDINRHSENIQKLIDLLGPDGLRKDIRKERLGGILGFIKKLNRPFWTVELNEETLEVTVDKRAVALCSEVQQWWADLIIRCAIAMRDKSDVILFDCIDRLNDNLLPKAIDLLERVMKNSKLKVIGASSNMAHKELATKHETVQIVTF